MWRVGHLIYGDLPPVDLDDRTLAHLKVVMLAKVRRHESFCVSWPHCDGHGRSTIWVTPSVSLRFTFEGAEAPHLDQELLARYAEESLGIGGIQLGAAPDAAQRPLTAAV